MCWPHITPKLTEWSFTFVCGQLDIRPAVGWQALNINGLLRPELFLLCFISIIQGVTYAKHIWEQDPDANIRAQKKQEWGVEKASQWGIS